MISDGRVKVITGATTEFIDDGRRRPVLRHSSRNNFDSS